MEMDMPEIELKGYIKDMRYKRGKEDIIKHKYEEIHCYRISMSGISGPKEGYFFIICMGANTRTKKNDELSLF